MQKQTEAATKIQAVFRGHEVRVNPPIPVSDSDDEEDDPAGAVPTAPLPPALRGSEGPTVTVEEQNVRELLLQVYNMYTLLRSVVVSSSYGRTDRLDSKWHVCVSTGDHKTWRARTCLAVLVRNKFQSDEIRSRWLRPRDDGVTGHWHDDSESGCSRWCGGGSRNQRRIRVVEGRWARSAPGGEITEGRSRGNPTVRTMLLELVTARVWVVLDRSAVISFLPQVASRADRLGIFPPI